MGFYDGLDYFKFGPELDVVSWDNYPQWHTTDNVEIAVSSAMTHDVMRSIKHENFLLMESTPSMTNRSVPLPPVSGRGEKFVTVATYLPSLSAAY